MQRQTLESLMGQRNTAHSSHSHWEYQELSGAAAKYIFNMSKSQVKSINYLWIILGNIHSFPSCLCVLRRQLVQGHIIHIIHIIRVQFQVLTG